MNPIAPIDGEWRQRLREAVARIGVQRVVAARLGISETTMTTMLLSPSAKVSFERVAAIGREAGVSLDWIAYGTRAPALDEALLAKAIAVVRLTFEDGQLSAADQARAVHLIYMRSLEHPDAPFSRSELLRLFGLFC